MPETTTENLGRAITRLGLEDKFLENGELQGFPLVQRGTLANAIITEKLRLGKWPTVIRMIWGGLGKADVLYDGDRTALRREIVDSAQQSTDILDERTLQVLAEKGEHDFIFELATTAPNLTYGGFREILNYLPRGYFEGPEGIKRSNLFEQVAGRKSFKEGKYDDAFLHFKNVGDKDGLTAVFEELMKPRNKSGLRSYHPVALLEAIAEADPDRREERLRRILTDFISGKIMISERSAFHLYKPLKSSVSEEDRQTLYDLVASRTSNYDFEEITKHEGKDPELMLLWAKHNATENPRASYAVFQEQNYQGQELQAAILKGLKLGVEQGDRNSTTRLRTRDVKPEHLVAVYDFAPFEIKVQIAMQLKDRERLSNLSQQARQQGKLNEAYRLWVDAETDFRGEYIDSLRTELIHAAINEELKERGRVSSPSFYFLNHLDRQGHIQAFDALMKHDRGKHRASFLQEAHELILLQGDTERLERVRKAMVSFNPRWALGSFMSTSYRHGRKEEMRDPVGFEYALGVIAERDGVEKDQLRTIVAKYGIGSQF